MKLWYAWAANDQYTCSMSSISYSMRAFVMICLLDVQDIYLHHFWFEYFDPWMCANSGSVLTRCSPKCCNFEARVARRILGQSRSTGNLSEWIAEHKIVIVRARSWRNWTLCPLMGATLLGLLMVALREQALVHPRTCQMSIIIDEFQSIPGQITRCCWRTA